MTKTQMHHITYEPEWTIELQTYHHKTITLLQHTKPTEEKYMYLNNFLHALTTEWNRYRMYLDTGGVDLDKLFGYGEKKKKKGKNKARKKLALNKKDLTTTV